MNLCLVCRDIGGDRGSGLARSARDLAEALAQAGHSVRLVTNGPPEPAERIPGVTVVGVPVPGPTAVGAAGPPPETALHNLMHAAAVYREVRRTHELDRPVDAVLAPLWRSEGAVCLLDDRFPTVVSCMTSLRTLTELDPAYRRLGDLDERMALERESLRRSPFLHGLTGAVLAKTIDDYGLHPDLTAVIGRGLRDRAGSRAGSGADRTPVRVLFVGRLERRKGVDTLLAAARTLLEEDVNVTFTLAGAAGDPQLRASFDREAVRAPVLRDVVRFTGSVSDAELDRLYADADIVCVPSRYESHGVVLVEAMMLGKAIVTCESGGIPEVVDAGATALLVPPDVPAALAAALRRVCAEPSLRERLGAAARAAYEARFTASSVADRMDRFLERVITLHRARAHPARRSDVRARLRELLGDVLALAGEEASELAGNLLDPPPSAWFAWAADRDDARTPREGRAMPATLDSSGLEGARSQNGAPAQVLASQEETIAWLRRRHETLCRIEDGGWWQLRGRLAPALRLAAWLRARV